MMDVHANTCIDTISFEIRPVFFTWFDRIAVTSPCRRRLTSSFLSTPSFSMPPCPFLYIHKCIYLLRTPNTILHSLHTMDVLYVHFIAVNIYAWQALLSDLGYYFLNTSLLHNITTKNWIGTKKKCDSFSNDFDCDIDGVVYINRLYMSWSYAWLLCTGLKQCAECV